MPLDVFQCLHDFEETADGPRIEDASRRFPHTGQTRQFFGRGKRRETTYATYT